MTGGAAQQSFIRGGSAVRSNPSHAPFYILFLTKKSIPFHIPSIDKLYMPGLELCIPRGRMSLTRY